MFHNNYNLLGNIYQFLPTISLSSFIHIAYSLCNDFGMQLTQTKISTKTKINLKQK